MITQEINTTAKRLKLYEEEQSTIYSSSNEEGCTFSKTNLQNNIETRQKSTDKGDTQDILAKACSVIGLGNSMIELAEPPNRIAHLDQTKQNNIHPVNGYADKRNETCFTNGYRSFPHPYYEDTNLHHSNGYKEPAFAWNKHSQKRCYPSVGPGKIQQHYTYPRYQYAWHSLNRPQPQNQPDRPLHYTNRPNLPAQTQCRLSYNNGMNCVSQNGVQSSYSITEGSRYTHQYANSCHRNPVGQVSPSMNSCRFPSPNYINSNNQYLMKSNYQQQEVSFHPNKNYHSYGNSYSQQQNNEVSMTKKIPGFENFSNVDMSKGVQISQYSPVSPPVSPYNPRHSQQSGVIIEKNDHFSNPHEDINTCIPNKSSNDSHKMEYRRVFSNNFYPPSSYQEDCTNNHVKQSSRRHSYPVACSLSGVHKTQHNVDENPNTKQFYSIDSNQINFANPDSACAYNTYDNTTMQSHITVDNIRNKDYNFCNSYDTCKNANGFPYQVNSGSKTIPIDYSLYGTDEIIKNSVKNSKPNLPHTPNIELIPLEGTSIISNLSTVSNKNLPEISINSIPLKENISWNPKDSYSCNGINNGLHNTNNANSYVVDNDTDCLSNQTKDSSVWHGKTSPQYTGIPELTSITNTEVLQGEYAHMGVKEIIDVGPLEEGDKYISDNNFIITRPLKIDKILNSNFIGPHSKHRPASEPLCQQRRPTFEINRPLSVPVRNDHYDNPHNLPPEEKLKIVYFEHKLKPVLEHLLSIPEASSFLSLKENPRELLKHLVKLWGGEKSLSSSKVPLINIKENFLMLVKLLFKANLLLEWGWQNATADRILDDLVTPAEEGYLEYRASLDVLKLICPPVQDPSVGVQLDENVFSPGKRCSPAFTND